mgnify:CR=1 FL=1
MVGMREIRFDSFGGPEVLTLHDDAPVPEPGPEEVLVQVGFDANTITGMFISMMFAGHHTTQGTAAWTLIELLRNPDYMARVYAELDEIYGDLDPETPTIAYCRIGERSSHTWFVLKELLGQQNVKNYDGSWTEYGSLIGVPIELGEGK